MKPTVAHITERYAVTGESYIYEQVANMKRFDAVILAETKAHTHFLPYGRYQALSGEFKSSFLNRARRFVRNRGGGQKYLRRLNDFYEGGIRRAGAQLIHIHFGVTACKSHILRRRLNLPIVVTFYGVDVSLATQSPYWIPRYQKMFEDVDCFLVLCEEAIERLVNIGCPKERIRLWDIGIALSEYPYRPPVAKTDARFLTVARFIEKKGYPILLGAFRMLANQFPNATLTLVGNGPMKQEIIRTLRFHHLTDRVTLIDTSEMHDFFSFYKETLRSHDIFVLPSVIAKDGDDEGGPPVTITNAMAVGLPVISTPVGGITRAIDDQVSGLLCDPGNPDDLAAKMKTLLDNPFLWERLSVEARKTVENRFSLMRQVEILEDVYSELLSGKMDLAKPSREFA